jgi:hypothetical protein
MGSARPARRSLALRVLTGPTSRTAEAVRGPPCAFVPLQRPIAAAPHRSAWPCGPRTMLPLLSFRAPRHTLGPEDPLRSARPRALPCHVRGLATPIAASTSVPTGARSAGASLGFALQGLTRPGGTPLGVPALLTFLREAPPLREASRRTPSGLRSRHGHDEGSSRTPRHVLPGLSPSRAPHPSSGPSLVVARPTLPPLGGMTSRPTWVSGPCEAKG